MNDELWAVVFHRRGRWDKLWGVSYIGTLTVRGSFRTSWCVTSERSERLALFFLTSLALTGRGLIEVTTPLIAIWYRFRSGRDGVAGSVSWSSPCRDVLGHLQHNWVISRQFNKNRSILLPCHHWNSLNRWSLKCQWNFPGVFCRYKHDFDVLVLIPTYRLGVPRHATFVKFQIVFFFY